ncbi:hypothetical protein BH10ACT2_BH10ACT2_22010 [soil metagenome]
MSEPTPQEILATAIATAVERQLTEHAATITKQFEARLAEYQKLTLNELNNRIIESAAQGAGDGIGAGGIDSGELVTLREQIDSSSAASHARIDELAKSARRFDEQASALVQHVNDTSQALTLRMDDGNQALATAVEERFGFVRATLEAFGPEITRQLAEQATAVAHRIDFTDNKITDRMLEMETRIVEQNGTKIAGLEATIGRIGSGFDEAIGALSQRLLELENSLSQVILHTNVLTEQISQVDAKAIEGIREQLSAAVGEAMLVRIEIDRVAATTDERLDRAGLRMAEIESLLSDEMDVSASVQLERLDELERAISALDPNQFVRKVDPGAGAAVVNAALSDPTGGTDRSLSSF